ncbi:hypothetical protein E2C01_097443 [Portunus trituberculatus]|uniref:Uncharacterized protein n=1 Tax=Portunus trituberculatus TaxID=210409 RepID=A0A5B7KB98_PORTR|nr:hypothetical protein [Portunus trituberculatus]
MREGGKEASRETGRQAGRQGVKQAGREANREAGSIKSRLLFSAKYSMQDKQYVTLKCQIPTPLRHYLLPNEEEEEEEEEESQVRGTDLVWLYLRHT